MYRAPATQEREQWPRLLSPPVRSAIRTAAMPGYRDRHTQVRSSRPQRLESASLRRWRPPSYHPPPLNRQIHQLRGHRRTHGTLEQLPHGLPVFVAVRDGKESSEVTLRVFSKNFEQVLSSVEAKGKVRDKEVRETTAPMEGKSTSPEEPDARIDISFVEKESSVVWRIIAIAAPVGGVALVALLGLLFYAAYRAGRHRGSLT